MSDGFDLKQALGVFAAALGLLGYLPYLANVARRRTRPHAYSWLIWGILCAIVFAGQVVERAGPGAYVTGMTALLCFVIFGFAIERGERSFTAGDKACLLFALLALPVWVVTDTPLYSVVIAVCIDAAGFYPTVRKTMAKPWEETLITYFVSSIKFAIALAAMESYSLTTTLYPIYLVVSNATFVTIILLRRRALGGARSPIAEASNRSASRPDE